MKKFNAMVAALTLILGLGLTSCMGETNYTPQWGGPIEVISWMGTTHFKDFGGLQVYPTTSSLESVKSSMKFDPNKTNVAYVVYEYAEEGNENMSVTGKLNNAQLRYAISLDAGVEYVMTAGASNDSVSTAPIMGLDDVVTGKGTQPISLIAGRYLFTGVNYLFNAKQHYFTLVHIVDEQEDGKVKFKLRHSGIPEANGVYTTSRGAFNVGLPYVYYKSFDIQNYLPTASEASQSFTIEVEVDLNTYTNELEGNNTEKKVYSLVYKPFQENE